MNVNNKYRYVKQNVLPTVTPSKVLINPNFNKTVFVNPNFRPGTTTYPIPGKIHVNPNVTINLPKDRGNIHVNPKVLQNLSITKQEFIKQPLTYSSKTKLVRKPLKERYTEVPKRVRRTSVYSKFKIIKSSVLNKSGEKNRLLFNSKYKLKRISANKTDKTFKSKTRFKLDNRRFSGGSKFVFINRYIDISDIAKKVPLRAKNIVNIGGNLYITTPNRLQKTASAQKNKKNSFNKQEKVLKKNKYKIVRLSQVKYSSEKRKSGNKVVSRYSSSKKQISGEKLRKCNIPCPYYRKLGKCKGYEQGKCPRKHDPDQIALCTKFLQGACIDSKCLLSHNVSPEKMPTCKYYLEGSCSKDICPYLHVRINPKADICRDFLEGFCKKAAECDKRHQFLCPDYEKKGVCQKPRCCYPHGRLVRKYSVFNKDKFAKKSSVNNKENTLAEERVSIENKREENAAKESTRYYSETNIENFSKSEQKVLKFRQKLGDLPAFISFEDT
ncbi:zinc finger CCCH domain-containing protein 3 [Diorhabda carinulata]|uniref:zinc finger CCCH domain-containing protein 3 n=1 Tax=Diorhabda carinulata TaxID=1163345 RepID=UPI0025A0F7C2|nr:zinc finger CCCH domain-containing protein 3 [Diorhabda carinulata]